MLYKFLSLAKVVSLHSNYKIKMGAVIVKHGKPIAIGFNNEKTSPNVYGKQKTIHAEISALITISEHNLINSTIFVYREHKNGLPALARPCANCLAILATRGVKRVIYSVDTYPYYVEEKI